METEQLTDYIFIDNYPEQADLAIVMGTTKTYEEASTKASNLFNQGIISNIIVSGGVNQTNGINEAELLAKTITDLGIPNSNIFLEPCSTNTLENVLFSRQLIEKRFGLKNIHSVIAVARNYHARRVLMTFTKHFPPHIRIFIASYESKHYPFLKDNWFTSELGQAKVLEEFEKIQKYLAKGDIQEPNW